MEKQIENFVSAATKIVVMQADNPDADSLGSALALEHILSDLGKDVAMYCGVNIPEYLRYLPGWDRILPDMPSRYDVAIIVDASTIALFEKINQNVLHTKPLLILDHHALVDDTMDFAQLKFVDASRASTGDMIFHLATSLGWPVSAETSEYIMASILGDTQGLTNELTSAETYRTMAALTELGADRPKLEEKRRQYGRMAEKVFRYKAKLISTTEFYGDGQIALVAINQADINEYSPHYNPVPLIMPDLLQVEEVALAVVIKIYDDGRITGALRSNNAYPIAGELAESLGGGGHPHASGFKITDGRNYEEVRLALLDTARQLLTSSSLV